MNSLTLIVAIKVSDAAVIENLSKFSIYSILLWGSAQTTLSDDQILSIFLFKKFYWAFLNNLKLKLLIEKF